MVSGLTRTAKNYGLLDFEVHIMTLSAFEWFRNDIVEKHKIDATKIK